MLSISKQLIALLTLLLLCSCGKSGYQFIKESSLAETQLLKEECLRINLDSKEVRQADSLLTIAERSDSEEAFLLSEMAAARYRLALTQHYNLKSSSIYLDAKDTNRESENRLELQNQILRNTRISRDP